MATFTLGDGRSEPPLRYLRSKIRVATQTGGGGGGSGPLYYNRARHQGGSFYTWVSVGEPDPDMSEGNPPNPVGEYSDFVVVKILAQ